MNRFLLLLLCSLIMGCEPSNQRPTSIVGLVEVKRSKPLYAKGFDLIQMSDSSWKIVILNTDKPEDTLQVIHWRNRSIDNIACLSTTHVPFIKALGRLNTLRATGFAEMVIDEEVKKSVIEGKIANLTIGYDLDDEKVYDISPQLLFVYPYGEKDYSKYLEAGIGCVQIAEYSEETPLGRAEWIKVFGVLLGEVQKADSIFNSITEEYVALQNRIAAETSHRPSVFTGSYDSGNWTVPPGNSFAAVLINDAGAHYIYSDSIAQGNLIIPFETIFRDAFDADFWGKVVQFNGHPDIVDLTGDDPRLSQLKAFRERNLFFCNTNQTDYHGQAILEPQLLLADLVRVFHPELLPNYQPRYFMRWYDTVQ